MLPIFYVSKKLRGDITVNEEKRQVTFSASGKYAEKPSHEKSHIHKNPIFMGHVRVILQRYVLGWQTSKTTIKRLFLLVLVGNLGVSISDP